MRKKNNIVEEIFFMNRKLYAIVIALLAAVLYAVNIPVSKILLQNVSPVYMASFLYFGAGVGIAVLSKIKHGEKAPALTKAELPYTVGMIVLDIVAPICLMLGLKNAASANVSLLNNFEIVVTSIIALVIFKESVSVMMWIAVILITLSSILLSFDGVESFHFSSGSVFVIIACICWGLENNCTRKLSSKSATQIVILKGLFSGLGSFIVANIIKEELPHLKYIVIALLLGFVSYGLSIYYYVSAQKDLGASRTSAYYSVNPFVASVLSLVILKEALSNTYFVALIVMLVGASFAVLDTLQVEHSHEHSHNRQKQNIVHTHSHKHFLGSKHHFHIHHNREI